MLTVAREVPMGQRPISEAWKYMEDRISAILRGMPVRDLDEAMVAMESAIQTAYALQSEQTLDLRGLKFAEMGRSGAKWIRLADIQKLILAQLPDVKVLTATARDKLEVSVT